MIEVERVNGLKVFINPDLVRTIEKAPDVIITFTDGEKLLLKTPPEEIIEKIILFKRRALPEIIG
jgi:flagellar protein FlbD